VRQLFENRKFIAINVGPILRGEQIRNDPMPTTLREQDRAVHVLV